MSNASTEPSRADGSMVYVDTHAHFYALFDPNRYFDSAWENFEHARGTYPSAQYTVGHYALMLTERSGQNWFERLRDRRRLAPPGTTPQRTGWRIEPLPEAGSVRVSRADGSRALYLLSGYQCVTRESIEVLSLFPRQRTADGAPLEDTLAAIRQAGGLPVLPWSPGKWLGHRGRALQNLLGKPNRQKLALGDVPCRLRERMGSRLFQMARRASYPILAGSDPLPIPRGIASPGRFGSRVEATWDPLAPGRAIRDAFLDPGARTETFGMRETGLEFLGNQIRLRLQGRYNRG